VDRPDFLPIGDPIRVDNGRLRHDIAVRQ
jgi:hypothetical protein